MIRHQSATIRVHFALGIVLNSREIDHNWLELMPKGRAEGSTKGQASLVTGQAMLQLQ